jgi:hypothetical protein
MAPLRAARQRPVTERSRHLRRRTFITLLDLDSPNRSGRSRHWIKSKNPKHPAVRSISFCNFIHTPLAVEEDIPASHSDFAGNGCVRSRSYAVEV